MAHLASSKQGPSTAKPRCNHVSAENPPNSPCPTLSAGARPKSEGSDLTSTKSANFS